MLRGGSGGVEGHEAATGLEEGGGGAEEVGDGGVVEVVEDSEGDDEVEGGLSGRVEVADVFDEKGASAAKACGGLADIVGFEVDADIVHRGEEVEDGGGATADVEDALAGLGTEVGGNPALTKARASDEGLEGAVDTGVG